MHDYYARVSSYVDFIDATTDPAWDGDYRGCPPECGCRAVGAPSGGSPALPGAVSLVLLGVVWRRRRAA